MHLGLKVRRTLLLSFAVKRGPQAPESGATCTGGVREPV
jgi:hypothetical protein